MKGEASVTIAHSFALGLWNAMHIALPGYRMHCSVRALFQSES